MSDGTGSATGYWKADAKKNLNDCLSTLTAGHWVLTATANGTNVRYVPSGAGQCLNLTPAFKGLSRNTI